MQFSNSLYSSMCTNSKKKMCNGDEINISGDKAPSLPLKQGLPDYA